MTVRALAKAAVVGALFLLACNTSDVAGNPPAQATGLTKIGTYPTNLIAGARYSDSIRVQVTDALGNPKSGAVVVFVITAGGGTLTPATVTTKSDGKAAAVFTRGYACDDIERDMGQLRLRYLGGWSGRVAKFSTSRSPFQWIDVVERVHGCNTTDRGSLGHLSI
jgi:hypothetical protein